MSLPLRISLKGEPSYSIKVYKQLGIDFRKIVALLSKAKQLKREGACNEVQISEITQDQETGQVMDLPPWAGVKLAWEGGRIILFSILEMLLDF